VFHHPLHIPPNFLTNKTQLFEPDARKEIEFEAKAFLNEFISLQLRAEHKTISAPPKHTRALFIHAYFAARNIYNM